MTGFHTCSVLPISTELLLPEPVLSAPQEIEFSSDYQDIYGYQYYYRVDRDNVEEISYYTIESDFAWRIREKDFESDEFYTYSVGYYRITGGVSRKNRGMK
jgi:hypothetical protein